MRIFVTVKTSFSAGHLIPDDPWCGREHGHDWTVAVTAEGRLDAKTGLALDRGALADAIEEIASEFRGRRLGDLLPGSGSETAEILVTYFHERLVLDFPRITAVEVVMGTVGWGGGVQVRGEWPIR